MQHHWIHTQSTFVRLDYKSLLVYFSMEIIIHIFKILDYLIEFLYLLLKALTFLFQNLLQILQGVRLFLEL
jgi:hypothetical protein